MELWNQRYCGKPSRKPFQWEFNKDEERIEERAELLENDLEVQEEEMKLNKFWKSSGSEAED